MEHAASCAASALQGSVLQSGGGIDGPHGNSISLIHLLCHGQLRWLRRIIQHTGCAGPLALQADIVNRQQSTGSLVDIVLTKPKTVQSPHCANVCSTTSTTIHSMMMFVLYTCALLDQVLSRSAGGAFSESRIVLAPRYLDATLVSNLLKPTSPSPSSMQIRPI